MSDQKITPSRLIVVLATIYLVAIAAPFDYPVNLWGISHLQYLDWGVRITALLGGLLLAFLVSHIDSRYRTRLPVRVVKALVYVVVPLLLLSLFYLLRVKTHYLGDGILRARQVELGVKTLPTEPLGHYANYLFYQLVGPLFHWTSVRSIEVLSYISGLLTYFAALWCVKGLFEKRSDRLMPFLILVFSGTAVLYCGYVETYMLLPALTILFMATGIRSVNGKLLPLVPMLLYLLLVLFHFKFLYVAPSILLLSWVYYQKGDKLVGLAGALAVLASVIVVIAVPKMSALPTIGLGSFLMDFSPGQSSYWLLSGQHLLDIANELVMTAAAALLVLALLVTRAGRTGLRGNLSLLFVAASLPGALAFVTLLHPELGYASDWDLFSSAGVVISLFAVTFYAAKPDLRLSRPAMVMLSSVAIVSFLSYAAVNADYDQSIRRQVDILTLAGDQGAVGFETMGNDLVQLHKAELAEQMWRRSMKIRPHWRIYNNLGQLALDRGNYDEAEFFLKKGMALDSTRSILVMNLGMAYRMLRRYELAEQYLHRAAELAPNDAGIHHNLAVLLAETNRYLEAEVESRAAVRLKPNDSMFLNALGGILSALGKYPEAEDYLLRAGSIHPESSEIALNISAFYVKIKRIDFARLILTDFLAHYPNSPGASRVQEKLDGLGK
jgi:tetratricopeptide (TPR) repeat protein